MIVTVLLISLVASFFIHLCIVALYVANRGKSRFLFNAFLVTAFFNFGLMLTLSFIAIQKPNLIQSIDFNFLLWVLAGFIGCFIFLVQAGIGFRIYTRSKNPKHYHYNYFGKKVYHKEVAKKSEVAIMFISLPFFLLIGAYFVARLFNLFFYGHI